MLIKTVGQALDIDSIKIVTFDWLEDSLLGGAPKRAKPYLVAKHLRERRARKDAQRAKRREGLKAGGATAQHSLWSEAESRAVAKFKKDCEDFEQQMLLGASLFRSGDPLLTRPLGGYELYRDQAGFAYNIALARANLTTNTNERYYLKVGHLGHSSIYPTYSPRHTRLPIPQPRAQQLQLFQTQIWPRRYACFSTCSSPGAAAPCLLLAPAGSGFEFAFSQFEAFFKLKTRLEWKDRFSIAAENEVMPDGTVLPKPFRYAIPERCFDPRRPDVKW